MAEKMGNLKRTNYCNEISEDMISKEVTLMGWVAKQRSLGSIVFVDLRDRSGIAQIVFDDSSSDELLEKASYFILASIITLVLVYKFGYAIGKFVAHLGL